MAYQLDVKILLCCKLASDSVSDTVLDQRASRLLTECLRLADHDRSVQQWVSEPRVAVVFSQNRNNGNAGDPGGNRRLGTSTGVACRSLGVSLAEKNADIAYAKSCNLVHFGVHKHLNNGNEMTADEYLFQEFVIYSRAGIGSGQMSAEGSSVVEILFKALYMDFETHDS